MWVRGEREESRNWVGEKSYTRKSKELAMMWEEWAPEGG